MDERLKILEMVRDGKVTPEQAVELLGAMASGDGDSAIVGNFVDIHDDQGPARRLRITGVSRKGTKTSFDIPLGVIKFFNGLFPNSIQFNVSSNHIDREQLMDRIYSGTKGVVYHEDGKDGGVSIELI